MEVIKPGQSLMVLTASLVLIICVLFSIPLYQDLREQLLLLCMY